MTELLACTKRDYLFLMDTTNYETAWGGWGGEEKDMNPLARYGTDSCPLTSVTIKATILTNHNRVHKGEKNAKYF